MADIMKFFAAAPQGVEPILEDELRLLGATGLGQTAGGVHFSGPYELALRACLWSRTAARILLPLNRFPVSGVDDIYAAAGSIPWEDHIAPGSTMAVNFSGTGSGVDNTMFGAQRVKDAVADRLRRITGDRPSVDTALPDFRINCHLAGGELELRVDLSGDALHRRGYRLEGRLAPLKENLAAALLIKAGWPAIAGGGGSFLDPFCGSGTLVIEAAMIAADAAPGLLRERWGFHGWKGNDGAVWKELADEARTRRDEGLAKAPRCVGFDMDADAVAAAADNAKRAGVGSIIHFEKKSLEAARPGAKLKAGLLLTNPPYGKRLGEKDGLKELYAELGDALKERFAGWDAAVFTGEPELGKRMGLRARKVNTFHNGPLLCRLLLFHVEKKWFVDRDGRDVRKAEEKIERAVERGAEAFLNRLKKNLRTVGKWAVREGLQCYRLYDADLPEYAVAVDIYGEWARVREYAPPSTVDPGKAAVRLEDALAVLPRVPGIDAGRIVLLERIKERKKIDPAAFDASGLTELMERERRFLVNCPTQGDPGLSPDRRGLRDLVARMSPGKRFLNLWCRAGTGTVSAAIAGAASTLSVDPDEAYIRWTRKNLELNGVRGRENRLMRDDPASWIPGCRDRFDLILLDGPPQRDPGYGKDPFDVVAAAAGLVDRDGALIYCANRRSAVPGPDSLPGLSVEEITGKTTSPDFKRKGTLRIFMISRPPRR